MATTTNQYKLVVSLDSGRTTKTFTINDPVADIDGDTLAAANNAFKAVQMPIKEGYYYTVTKGDSYVPES